MNYFKLYTEDVLVQLVYKTPLVDSYFDAIGKDIVNYGRVYYGDEKTMMLMLRQQIKDTLEDQEQQDFKYVYQWLAEHAGLLVRKNIHQQWVSTHTELQLLRGVIVFQTLADFAYIYLNTTENTLKDMIRSGVDELLVYHGLRTMKYEGIYHESDTEPSQTDTTETQTDITEVTETTATTTNTDVTTGQLEVNDHGSRNSYMYTFAQI